MLGRPAETRPRFRFVTDCCKFWPGPTHHPPDPCLGTKTLFLPLTLSGKSDPSRNLVCQRSSKAATESMFTV